MFTIFSHFFLLSLLFLSLVFSFLPSLTNRAQEAKRAAGPNQAAPSSPSPPHVVPPSSVPPAPLPLPSLPILSRELAMLSLMDLELGHGRPLH
jgi:hypothetical protein